MSEAATHLCNQDAEIERLKAENARLAAGLWSVREYLVRDDTGGAVKALGELLARNSTALSALFAPTSGLLLRLFRFTDGDRVGLAGELHGLITAELSRLKAITGAKT